MSKPAYHYLLLLLSLIFFACKEEITLQSFPKIDTHVHLRTEDPAIMKVFEDLGFSGINICVRADRQTQIDSQFHYAQVLKKQFPERLEMVTTFSMEGFGSPGWEARTIEKLKRDFDRGAIGVKVWKDIGMTFRDTSGAFIMIDDARFDPVLAFITQQNKTLVAHIGEPKNCWMPLSEMTVNNDRSYFKNHPEYHMYLHPEFPSYEEQVEARDRMLEKHPNLRVVGAHLASLEWSVSELAGRLDRFPNLWADMAARICHFQVQDRDKVIAFFERYQDRLLYATDLGIGADDDPVSSIKYFKSTWEEDWNYFSSDKMLNSDKVPERFQGLNLPRTILEKIYAQNALEAFEGLREWKSN